MQEAAWKGHCDELFERTLNATDENVRNAMFKRAEELLFGDKTLALIAFNSLKQKTPKLLHHSSLSIRRFVSSILLRCANLLPSESCSCIPQVIQCVLEETDATTVKTCLKFISTILSFILNRIHSITSNKDDSDENEPILRLCFATTLNAITNVIVRFVPSPGKAMKTTSAKIHSLALRFALNALSKISFLSEEETISAIKSAYFTAHRSYPVQCAVGEKMFAEMNFPNLHMTSIRVLSILFVRQRTICEQLFAKDRFSETDGLQMKLSAAECEQCMRVATRLILASPAILEEFKETLLLLGKAINDLQQKVTERVASWKEESLLTVGNQILQVLRSLGLGFKRLVLTLLASPSSCAIGSFAPGTDQYRLVETANLSNHSISVLRTQAALFGGLPSVSNLLGRYVRGGEGNETGEGRERRVGDDYLQKRRREGKNGGAFLSERDNLSSDDEMKQGKQAVDGDPSLSCMDLYLSTERTSNNTLSNSSPTWLAFNSILLSCKSSLKRPRREEVEGEAAQQVKEEGYSYSLIPEEYINMSENEYIVNKKTITNTVENRLVLCVKHLLFGKISVQNMPRYILDILVNLSKIKASLIYHFLDTFFEHLKKRDYEDVNSLLTSFYQGETTGDNKNSLTHSSLAMLLLQGDIPLYYYLRHQKKSGIVPLTHINNIVSSIMSGSSHEDYKGSSEHIHIQNILSNLTIPFCYSEAFVNNTMSYLSLVKNLVSSPQSFTWLYSSPQSHPYNAHIKNLFSCINMLYNNPTCTDVIPSSLVLHCIIAEVLYKVYCAGTNTTPTIGHERLNDDNFLFSIVEKLEEGKTSSGNNPFSGGLMNNFNKSVIIAYIKKFQHVNHTFVDWILYMLYYPNAIVYTDNMMDAVEKGPVINHHKCSYYIMYLYVLSQMTIEKYVITSNPTQSSTVSGDTNNEPVTISNNGGANENAMMIDEETQVESIPEKKKNVVSEYASCALLLLAVTVSDESVRNEIIRTICDDLYGPFLNKAQEGPWRDIRINTSKYLTDKGLLEWQKTSNRDESLASLSAYFEEYNMIHNGSSPTSLAVKSEKILFWSDTLELFSLVSCNIHHFPAHVKEMIIHQRTSELQHFVLEYVSMDEKKENYNNDTNTIECDLTVFSLMAVIKIPMILQLIKNVLEHEKSVVESSGEKGMQTLILQRFMLYCKMSYKNERLLYPLSRMYMNNHKNSVIEEALIKHANEIHNHITYQQSYMIPLLQNCEAHSRKFTIHLLAALNNVQMNGTISASNAIGTNVLGTGMLTISNMGAMQGAGGIPSAANVTTSNNIRGLSDEIYQFSVKNSCHDLCGGILVLLTKDRILETISHMFVNAHISQNLSNVIEYVLQKELINGEEVLNILVASTNDEAGSKNIGAILSILTNEKNKVPYISADTIWKYILKLAENANPLPKVFGPLVFKAIILYPSLISFVTTYLLPKLSSRDIWLDIYSWRGICFVLKTIGFNNIDEFLLSVPMNYLSGLLEIMQQKWPQETNDWVRKHQIQVHQS